jgi:hypothetical protein
MLTPEQQANVAMLKDAGVPLSAGQETGNRLLKAADAAYATHPMTANRSAATAQETQNKFNRAILSYAGIDAEKATPEVMQGRKQELGQIFSDLSSRNTLKVTPEFQDNLTKFTQEANFLPTDARQPALNRVQDLLGKVRDGSISGTAYRSFDSSLGRQLGSTQNGDLRNALGNLRDVVREAMDASILPEDQALWTQARQQYAFLQKIAGAMNKTTEAATSGDISPAAIAHAVSAGASKPGAFGRGQMTALARAAKSILPETIPNSGTVQRSIAQRLIGAGNLGLGGFGTASAMFGHPYYAAGALGAYLTPWLTQKAYLAPLMQRYMRASRPPGWAGIAPQAGLLGAVGAGQTLGLLNGP